MAVVDVAALLYLQVQEAPEETLPETAAAAVVMEVLVEEAMVALLVEAPEDIQVLVVPVVMLTQVQIFLVVQVPVGVAVVAVLTDFMAVAVAVVSAFMV